MIMTSPDKPLHVRVAEVLGWTGIYYAGNFMVPDSDLYMGKKPGEMLVGREGLSGVPRFDTSWSATGPLIEKYHIEIEYHPFWSHGEVWGAATDEAVGVGTTPLLAVCDWVLERAKELSEYPDFP
jgi:hypothetical protein